MSRYIKGFEEIKHIYFLKRDDELLKNVIATCTKPATVVKEHFAVKKLYSKKYLKPKKIYEGQIITTLYCDGSPKKGTHCIFFIRSNN